MPLLTPYTQLTMAHRSTTTSAGLRYALDTSLDLDLSANRVMPPGWRWGISSGSNS